LAVPSRVWPSGAGLARTRIAERFGHLDQHLSKSPFLLDTQFRVANAYRFTLVGWAELFAVEVAAYPHCAAVLAHALHQPVTYVCGSQGVGQYRRPQSRR
jgi:glutathione S-transferase